MLCVNCLKLGSVPSTVRKCCKCNEQIHNNISVICDGCSSKEKICSVCLKKTQRSLPITNKCKACGQK